MQEVFAYAHLCASSVCSDEIELPVNRPRVYQRQRICLPEPLGCEIDDALCGKRSKEVTKPFAKEGSTGANTVVYSSLQVIHHSYCCC